MRRLLDSTEDVRLTLELKFKLVSDKSKLRSLKDQSAPGSFDSDNTQSLFNYLHTFFFIYYSIQDICLKIKIYTKTN